MAEFLQLAHVYKPKKHKIGGWFVSEKLDGTRCLWDGGVTRGLATEQVPWANVTNPKTGEPKKKIKPIATGLWSRNGNPIMAPDDFLDQLPPFICDGELWAGRGNFQTCRSICGRDTPDDRWDQISFAVFSTPSAERVFAKRDIKSSSFVASIDPAEIDLSFTSLVKSNENFTEEYIEMCGYDTWNEQVYPVTQYKLSMNEAEARVELDVLMSRFLDEGAEGVILRAPDNLWSARRVHKALKYKPWDDDEGTVVGFTSGRKTEKGSKLLGMIGALILDYKGKRLELSGLTNEERLFASTEMSAHAVQNPGVDMPEDFQGKHFKTGDRVTFKYRELSDDGIPKEGRYWRQRGTE